MPDFPSPSSRPVAPAGRYVALVPAAGGGSRMGADRPKQYLELLGAPLLAHTLEALLAVPELTQVGVVLAPEDAWWPRFSWPRDARLTVLRCGGATRAASVAAGLAALRLQAQDWVLVHDAARACIAAADVQALIAALREDPVGGLLALPVADTLKRADAHGRVEATVARESMWQAQTPQMFRNALLSAALAAHPEVTDEAGAMEAAGHAPRLVPGPATNFKLTYPRDLALAAQILAARRSETR